MKIIAVRHGETVGNVAHLVQSRTGDTLTERGKEQAAAAGLELQTKQFDVVYCSDLQRCIETAVCMNLGSSDMPFITTKRLRERNQGIYEGKQWEDLPWYQFEGDNLTTQIPEGESWVQVAERIRLFLNDVYAEHSTEAVLFVTHGGPVKALRAIVEGIPLKQSVDEPIANGTIWSGEMTGPFFQATVS